MSIQDFALGARAGRLDLHDEEARAERRVREVLRLTQDLRELFPGSGGILDIAVGNAEAVPWYRSLFRGVRLVCLEPERPSPALARFGGLAHYRRFDGIRIPYAGDSFDVVTGHNALSEASPEHRPLLLGELLRVLKPGGLLILFEPTSGEVPFGSREARRAARDAGFWNVSIRYGGAIPFLPLGPEYHLVGCKL